jgi:hypothetical protein
MRVERAHQSTDIEMTIFPIRNKIGCLEFGSSADRWEESEKVQKIGFNSMYDPPATKSSEISATILTSTDHT